MCVCMYACMHFTLLGICLSIYIHMFLEVQNMHFFTHAYVCMFVCGLSLKSQTDSRSELIINDELIINELNKILIRGTT